MLTSLTMGRTDEISAIEGVAGAAPLTLPREVTDRLITPALVIDLARVRANVARVLEVIGDPQRWRPHVKSTKSPLVWRELVGAGVRRFKCATLREARELCALLEATCTEAEAGDVLLAHPAHGPTLAGLGTLAATHPRVRLSILSEEPAHAASVPEPLGIWLDLDPGDHRTGLPLGRHEEALAIAHAAGPRLRGVHFYEGRHHQVDREERRRACFASHDALLEDLAALRAAGILPAELVTSGTPGFRSALAHPGLQALEGVHHQVSPGTVVLHDARSHEQEPDLGLTPAAVVASRVVSRPTPTRLTCDAGSKSVAAEAGDPCALVLGRPGLHALAPSEEHLPFEVRSGAAPTRGELLQLVPRHVCPTVNLAEAALFLDGDEVLGVHPIPARAHDLLLEEPTP